MFFGHCVLSVCVDFSVDVDIGVCSVSVFVDALTEVEMG